MIKPMLTNLGSRLQLIRDNRPYRQARVGAVPVICHKFVVALDTPIEGDPDAAHVFDVEVSRGSDFIMLRQVTGSDTPWPL
jgi:hypothetical protein